MYYKYCIFVFCVLILNFLFVVKDIILNAPTSHLKRFSEPQTVWAETQRAKIFQKNRQQCRENFS